MLKLYHFPTSPYGWIARMALAEKGLSYESTHPYDRKDNPELSRLNPLNRTPVLVIDGKPVFESMAILELLEERFPEPPLLPKDAFARAEARAVMVMAYVDLLPEAVKLGRAVLDYAAWDPTTGQAPPMKREDQIDQKMRDEGTAGVSRVLGNLERFARRSEWLAGAFSLADIAWTPFVSNLAFRGYAVPSDLDAVRGWLSRLQARPSFVATKPSYFK